MKKFLILLLLVIPFFAYSNKSTLAFSDTDYLTTPTIWQTLHGAIENYYTTSAFTAADVNVNTTNKYWIHAVSNSDLETSLSGKSAFNFWYTCTTPMNIKPSYSGSIAQYDIYCSGTKHIWKNIRDDGTGANGYLSQDDTMTVRIKGYNVSGNLVNGSTYACSGTIAWHLVPSYSNAIQQCYIPNADFNANIFDTDFPQFQYYKTTGNEYQAPLVTPTVVTPDTAYGTGNYPNPAYSIWYGDYPAFRLEYIYSSVHYLVDCNEALRWNSTTKKLFCNNNKFHIYSLDGDDWGLFGHGDDSLQLDDLTEATLNSCSDIVYQNSNIYNPDRTAIACAKLVNGVPVDSDLIHDQYYECQDLVAKVLCGIKNIFVPDSAFMESTKTEIKTAWDAKMDIDTTNFDTFKNALVSETTIPPIETTFYNPITESEEDAEIVDVNHFKSGLSPIRAITTSILALHTIFLLFGIIKNLTAQ